MTGSFAKFFNEVYFKKDHAYRRFRLFREMAKPFHIYKRPITFDKGDIQFIQQFPRKFWLQAMERRYRHDLFEALRDREDRRNKLRQEKLKQVLPQLLSHWRQREKPAVAEKMAKRQASLVAEEYAAKHDDGQIEYPKEKDYTFKPAGKGKPVTIRAKPYMSELVYKLEGDYGDPTGYDLEYPRVSHDGKHMATRGFNFPTKDTIREMLNEWMNYIAHHMLGELPSGEGVRWRADNAGGSGKTKVTDTFTVNRLKEQRYKFWYDRIPTEENPLRLWQQVMQGKKTATNSEEIRRSNSKREQLARALAERDIRQWASEGKIKTPPTPDHPEGRTVETNSDGEIVHPDLYLPHKKRKIRYVDDGQVEEAEEELPVLLPGDFLRRLSSDEAEALDDADKVGRHWDHESGKFSAQYTRVTDHPSPGAQGTDHIHAGALSPNHNTTGRKFLDPSDPNYSERLEALHDAIGMRDDGQSDEIYSAIEQALEASNVGGMGNFERQILMLMKRDLHQLAYMMLAENLDEDERHIFSPEWRKRKIRELVGKYGQQDWGRGTRRLRGSKTTSSLEEEEDTEDGPMSLADRLSIQLGRAKKAALAMRGSGECRVPPGGKKLNVGQCQFEYDLRNLHDMLDDASQEAARADAEIQQAEDGMDSSPMEAGVQSKIDATFRAFTVLKAQYINIGEHDDQAEKLAFTDLQAITKDEPAAKTIIARVRRRVDQLADESGSTKAELPQVDRAADVVGDDDRISQASVNLSQIEEVLNGLLRDGEVERYLARVNSEDFEPSIRKLMGLYPSLRQRYQRLLTQAEETRRQIAQPPARRVDSPITREANQVDLKELMEKDRLELVPFNTQFRRLVGEGRITLAAVRQMLSHLRSRKGTLFATPHDNDAIDAFEQILGGT